MTALLSPFQRDIPIVVSLDATPINYDTVGAYYGHTSGGPLESLKLRANRRAFAHAAALIVWRAWAKDSLVNDYGVPAEKIHVISPGVDLAQWPRVTPEERLARARDASPGCSSSAATSSARAGVSCWTASSAISPGAASWTS